MQAHLPLHFRMYLENSTINGLTYRYSGMYVCTYVFIYGCIGSSFASWSFSSCGERGLLFVAAHGLLTAVASLVAEHGLLGTLASVVAAH